MPGCGQEPLVDRNRTVAQLLELVDRDALLGFTRGDQETVSDQLVYGFDRAAKDRGGHRAADADNAIMHRRAFEALAISPAVAIGAAAGVLWQGREVFDFHDACVHSDGAQCSTGSTF